MRQLKLTFKICHYDNKKNYLYTTTGSENKHFLLT